MLSKYTLPHYKFHNHRPKRFWPILKFAIIILIILAGLYFLVNYVFAQKLADKDLKVASELQAADDCKSAISNYKAAAVRSKKDHPTFMTALNGLWSCNELEWAQKYTSKIYDKRPGDDLTDLLAQMMITRFSIDSNNKAVYSSSESDISKIKDLLKKSSPLTKITYQTIFEEKISENDSEYQELINKINSPYNIKTKILIIAQYLNENNSAQFGTDLAERIQDADKNYRDAYLVIGYGYLKLNRLNDAKTPYFRP